MSQTVPGIVLCGATGRTGNAVAHALAAREDVRLVACVAPSVATTPTRPLPADTFAAATLADALDGSDGATVLVDFSPPDAALEHLQLAFDHGLDAVVGTTGFMPGQLESFGERYDAGGRSLLYVPNFSLGAVLGMRVAAELARHFPDVEIVETHHDGKRDAPSGTAVHTAQLVAAARRDAGLEPGPGAATAGTGGGRGESVEGVPVHALRLPGATAHQEVVFGAPGELLTIRHDAIDRSCYAAGVALAARRVHEFRGLNTGLETVL
jgi:4-hydroxy-tetrahydrodipicolinate reductase